MNAGSLIALAHEWCAWLLHAEGMGSSRECDGVWRNLRAELTSLWHALAGEPAVRDDDPRLKRMRELVERVAAESHPHPAGCRKSGARLVKRTADITGRSELARLPRAPERKHTSGTWTSWTSNVDARGVVHHHDAGLTVVIGPQTVTLAGTVAPSDLARVARDLVALCERHQRD